MKRIGIVFVMAAGLMHAQTWDSLVDHFFDEAVFPFNPTEAVSQGFHAYDAQLEDYSKAAMQKQVEAWKGGAAASALTTSNWSTQEWLHFLRALPDTIPAQRLDDLDKSFKLSSSGNSEIQFEWFRIAIANHYEPAFAALEHFLTSQGRRKFVAPLYADLAKTEWGKPIAMRIYRQARPTYHSVATGTIDKTLSWK